ncbi:ABC transporter ATP-binding protein [Natronoarchaeum mannanilyticum]|uniref:ABC transporter ATP-binding protein n=1 Tax=Natronoarchaeum mannanilyticum TaxID=926360 RepID=A0AAV3T691_9EURY
MSDAIVTATGVEKRFDDQPVLTGIDLDVRPGEIVLLMGPNGVGKSVFMSCLAGSTAPDAGEIELFDGLTPDRSSAQSSVMLQGTMTDPDLTGRENLQFYEDLHPRGTDEWEALAERLELGADLDRLVREYSGGMERKVEIASALSADVPLYLLDEPTAELDLAMIQTLHDLLLARRDEGKAFLVTSHTPLDARIADRIAFVQNGRVVADGEPETLLDDLPPVVRVRGGVPDEDRLLGERAFRRGDEIRGFLPAEADVDAIAASVDGDARVELDPPSYTDLFNYHTYVGPEVAEGKGTGGRARKPVTN